MGMICFIVPSRESLPEGALEQAYLAGLEGIPWRSETVWLSQPGETPQVFAFKRTESESGSLSIAWQIPNRGRLVLATSSLRERSEPYWLGVELARGAVYRLRQQLAEWEAEGLVAPAELKAEIRQTETQFRACVIGCRDLATSTERADQVIERSMQLGDLLAAAYSEQVLVARHQREPRLNTLFGLTLDRATSEPAQARDMLRMANAVALGLTWRSLEPQAGRFDWDAFDQALLWCRQHQLRVLSGPLLSNSGQHLPQWLSLWADDCDAVQGYLIQFIRALVNRYRGAVNVWNCAAGLNVPGVLPLSDEETLRLLVTTIEEVRKLDPETPVIACFDQPWAEFLANDPLACSPLHLADSLIRADLGLAGIGLELNLGYWPHGTLPRDLLEISSQIDRWSMLGLPLVLYLTVPSDAPATTLSERSSNSLESTGSWPGIASGGAQEFGTNLSGPTVNDATPTGAAVKRLWPGFAAGSSPAAQAEFLAKLVPLLIAKPMVQGLIWNQTHDSGTAEYPTGGLFDRLGQPKPALSQLASIREAHLM